MSLVYRDLRTLHYMDLPSTGRTLEVNFSGVIAFDFSINVVANTVFGSHKQKKQRKNREKTEKKQRNKKTNQYLVSCSNGNK